MDVSTDPGPPLASPDPTTPRRRHLRLLLVVGIAALAGAVAATALVLVFGQPKHQYNVTVFVADDITPEQKTAVKAALPALHPVNGVQFEDRAQAWKRFQQLFKDAPDLLASSRAEYMPESFRLETTGREFDCAALARVRRLPGVKEVQVVQRPVKGHTGAVVACS
ncbi:hypothetical protein HC031_16235 [Planosporangium thailandense]|uniref:FtsX extracellular domain-containing protein n=1 Tax=Planosporangium thailandense TaxID=765197 RepID=A0ABX0XYU9_9ACTN|nr:permease-like cell division protein FtsX [Planosporangium thailandense]NJC71249.1 hypothetical protein [Planosporangium thailandense]